MARARAASVRYSSSLATASSRGIASRSFRRADVSIAYRAKPRVRAQAMHAIDYCGLDAVLNLFN